MEGVGLLFANSKVSASTFLILVLTDTHLLSFLSTNLNIFILSYFSFFDLFSRSIFLFLRSFLAFTLALFIKANFFRILCFYYKLKETC